MSDGNAFEQLPETLRQLKETTDAGEEMLSSSEANDVTFPGGATRPTMEKRWQGLAQDLGDRLPIRSFDTVEQGMASEDVAVGDEFRVKPSAAGRGGQRWRKGVAAPEFIYTEAVNEDVAQLSRIVAQGVVAETDFASLDMDEDGRVFGGILTDGTMCYLQSQHGTPRDGLLYKYNQVSRRLEVYKVNDGAYELFEDIAYVDVEGTEFEDCNELRRDPAGNVFWAQKKDGTTVSVGSNGGGGPVQPPAKSNTYSFYTLGGRVFSSNFAGTKRLDLGPGRDPALASPDHIKWTGSDGLDYFAELGSAVVHPLVAKLRLAVHGDSQYTSTFVDPLSRMLGIPVHGCVQSGLPTASMAARAGWVPMLLRMDNNEIPASGSVNCQHLNPPFRIWSKAIEGPRNVTLNGVHGVLRKFGDTSGGSETEVPEYPEEGETEVGGLTYTFFRDQSGAAVPCALAGVPAVFDLLPGYGDDNGGRPLQDRDDLLQLSAGGGNNRTATQLIFDTHKAADVFTKARVRGNLFGSWIIRKNQAENGEFAANRALRAMMTDYFGVRHVDSYLVLRKAVRNQEDQAEVDAGRIPSWVYRSTENIHLDNIGRVFLAAEYARRYVYLGYVPDIDDGILDSRIATEMARYGWTLPVPAPLYTRQQVMATRTE